MREIHESPHAQLIRLACEVYAREFLPDYEIVFIDDGDGDRVRNEYSAALKRARLSITLGDAMPDVLLWSPTQNSLWVIEAVTSDGEVDEMKRNMMEAFAIRNGKRRVNFTTAYLTWKETAARQGAHRNLAVNSYVWIAEDPGRALLVTSSEPPRSLETVPLLRRSPPE